MNLQARIEDVKKRFDEVQGVMKEKQKEIEAISKEAEDKIRVINQEIVEIGAELNRMQGEYRLLTELIEQAPEVAQDVNAEIAG